MSAAVTSPGPCLRRYMTTGSSCSDETTSSFRFRMMSVTSSVIPATVENSCSTPSILRLVTAAPGIDDSRVRRSEFPMVYPNPGSSGSMTNLDRNSSTASSVSVGRWAMSMTTPFRGARYMTPRSAAASAAATRRWMRPGLILLLRVQLDDELLLYLRVDLGTAGQRVHQYAHLVRDDLQPGRYLPLAGLGPGHDERRHLQKLGRHLDDVALAYLVGGNVHLLAVDQEVPVPDELAGHVPALGEPGAVDHVVEAALQDLEQVVAGLAAPAGGFLVVAVELPLENPVDALGLLLLAGLEQVLVLLGPVAPVLTRRVRPDLDRALGRVALGALEEELHLLAAAELAVRSRIPSHFQFLSDPAPLGRAAAVVGDRGDVLDGADLQAGCLERADRGFPARAGALHEHVDLAHAVFHGAAGGCLGGHLGGVRRRLARPLEANLAR